MHSEDPPIGLDDLRDLLGELRMVARQLLNSESRALTLTPTALALTALRRAKAAHLDWESVQWANRAHFFSALHQAMRHALVDHARHRSARGRDQVVFVPPDDSLLVDLPGAADNRPDRFLALDDALDRLAAADPDLVTVLRQHYFLGYTVPEIARIENCSEKTVDRHLQRARVLLRKLLSEPSA